MLLRQIILARQAVTEPDSETTGLTKRCVFDAPDSQPDNKKRENRGYPRRNRKKKGLKIMETMTVILGAVIAIAAVVSNFTIIK